MALEAVADFVERINAVPALLEQCRAAVTGTKDAAPFVALGKSNGFDFTADEATEFFRGVRQAAGLGTGLDDAQLGAVAGGKKGALGQGGVWIALTKRGADRQGLMLRGRLALLDSWM